ncbi:acylneuraminate cytidylyltransferase, partial [Vibrio parahaemolyticus]
YKKLDDRIGLKPSMYIQDAESSIDIDWPEDFTFAEVMWKKNL